MSAAKDIGAGVESMTDIVAIEHKRTLCLNGQELVDAIGDRALATAAESRKPDNTSARTLDALFVPFHDYRVER